ncbi:lipoprotein [Hyphomonas sp.]|jgi:predicted small lipoprotein YifL|uniref:LPS translocon maturation chaperone LptM n=1 Tax=Hyphomonas sp. TaxID=87 RepID=UPI000407ED08|nr:lipoprotein [Hyphomonas sp.]MEE2922537.1 lipoprotein [Pseudomonadota bacterium]|tara:strand:- start:281 stop:511 length:231 start_codon:yes stop_codon:yes gene_type:complete
MKRPLLLAAALLAAGNLAACGLTGDLKRPDPLWGDPSGELDPAELPQQNQTNLPDLPDREEDEAEQDADDELLGGV